MQGLEEVQRLPHSLEMRLGKLDLFEALAGGMDANIRRHLTSSRRDTCGCGLYEYLILK